MTSQSTKTTTEALKRIEAYTDGQTEFVSASDTRDLLDELAYLQSRVQYLEATVHRSEAAP